MCLAIAMACSFILISCGKDDPVSEGPTPPTEPTTPTEPTATYKGRTYSFQFLKASGDSVNFRKYFVDAVEKIYPDLRQVDEFTYTIGAKYLETDGGSSKVFDNQIAEIRELIIAFGPKNTNEIDVPIYISKIATYRTTFDSVSEDWDWSSLNKSDYLKGGSSDGWLKTPNMTNTNWTTNEQQTVKSILFGEERIKVETSSGVSEPYQASALVKINENDFTSIREGDEIKVSAKDSEEIKYIFKLSEFGKKLSLIQEDGQEVNPAIEYTREEAQAPQN